MSAAKSLDALRRDIDRIDDEIHDLIQRRTRIVEKVRDVKKGDAVKIRPSREDEILYRLVARHAGNFPKRELTRIWRELIVATLSFEGPFSVAVCAGDDAAGCWDLARDQYGSFTPMAGYPSARRVIDAVGSQSATVGILPLPRRDDADPWWPHLVADSRDVPRVIARLPFAGPGNGPSSNAEAFVVCPVSRQPTGRDRSLFVVETDADPGLTRLGTALAAAGLAARFTAVWRDPASRGPRLFLAEVDGFVVPGDRALLRLASALECPVNRIVGLGTYGVPLTAEELAPGPAEAPPARRRRTTKGSRKRRS